MKTNNMIDFYTKFVYDLNSLSDHDKKVYRLGVKVYLCFDGDDELRDLMDKWEKTILPRHLEILKPHLKNVRNDIAITRTLVHLLENLIQNIVVKNRFLPEEEIREVISVVLHCCE